MVECRRPGPGNKFGVFLTTSVSGSGTTATCIRIISTGGGCWSGYVRQLHPPPVEIFCIHTPSMVSALDTEVINNLKQLGVQR